MKHNRQKFIKRIFIAIGLTIILVLAIQQRLKTQDTSVVITDQTTDSELEAIMNEAKFSQETILRAKTVKLTRERAKEEERHQQAVAEEKARYDAKMGQLEASLETVRKESLSLQSAPTQ